MVEPAAAGGRVLVLFMDRPARARWAPLLGDAAFARWSVSQGDSARWAQAEIESGRHDVALLLHAPAGRVERRTSDLVARLAEGAAVVVAGSATDSRHRDLRIAGACEILAAEPRGPDLREALSRAVRMGRALDRVARFDPRRPLGRQIGSGPGVETAIRMVERAAAASAPVLVTGEPGGGKSIVARSIHAHERARRRGGPFLRCLVGALDPEDLPATLYGAAGRPGLVELAHGGTLYLEEVDALPAIDQARLADLLEQGPRARVTRADGSSDAPAEIRLIAGTSASLAEEAGRGRFRWDLLDRLRVLPVNLPPLRSRPGDIPALATELIDRAATRLGLPIVGLSPGAMAALQRYSWPGNLRELERWLAEAVVRARGPLIEQEELVGPGLWRGPADGPRETPPGALEVVISLDDALPVAEAARRAAAAAEIASLRRALERTGGNVSRAARTLGVSRTWVQRRMRQYGLTRR